MNRHDRNVLIACVITTIIALLAFWWSSRYQVPVANVTKPSYQHRAQKATRASGYYATEERQVERFPFDPNTADSTQLLRLGLASWQVKNIYKYRGRGGVYRSKEDFAQIYGLTKKQYRELEPYIHISADYLPASQFVKKPDRDTVRHYPEKMKEGEQVMLNTADTSQLQRVPGIGSYYAKEIVHQRQRLGGFVSLDQLDAIDGFPQQAKPYLVVQQSGVRKLNLNQLSLQQLRQHPYLNYFQAKAIVDYRRLHGSLKSLNDLRFSRDFTDEAIRRLEPYVAF